MADLVEKYHVLSLEGSFRCALFPNSLQLSTSDIRFSLETREHGWLRRRALAVAISNRVALILASSSVLFLVMLPFTEKIARFVGFTPATTQIMLLGIAGVLLLMAAALWRNAYRWAMPGLLLQIDRCGCCGTSLNSRRLVDDAKPTATLSARCTECGVDWSSGARVGFVVSQLEHICNAA